MDGCSRQNPAYRPAKGGPRHGGALLGSAGIRPGPPLGSADAVIERILPPVVAVAETREDLIEIELFPEEERATVRAVEKRRREFTTGRACAREALSKLGIAPAPPIARGEKGEPLWPAGVVGSITHCRGYRAATVARAQDLASLGVDAEEHAPLPDGVLEAVSSARERARLAAAARANVATADASAATASAAGANTHLDRVLFSAKEAIYKAWFPLTRRWLGFEDVDLTIDTANHTFHADLLVSPPQLDGRPLTTLTGRWLVEADIVAAACVVEQPGPGAEVF